MARAAGRPGTSCAGTGRGARGPGSPEVEAEEGPVAPERDGEGVGGGVSHGVVGQAAPRQPRVAAEREGEGGPGLGAKHIAPELKRRQAAVVYQRLGEGRGAAGAD